MSGQLLPHDVGIFPFKFPLKRGVKCIMNGSKTPIGFVIGPDVFIDVSKFKGQMSAIDIECPLIQTADLFIHRTVETQEAPHDLLVDLIKRGGAHLKKGKRSLRRKNLLQNRVIICIERDRIRNDWKGVHMLLRIIGVHDVLFGMRAKSAQGRIGFKGVTRLIE